MSKRKANARNAADDVERQPVSLWRQEALAMADAAVVARRIGMSLPEESGTRQALIKQARRYALGARLRGIEVTA